MKLSKGNPLGELTTRLRARAKKTHRRVDRGLRRLLEESASPSCCAVEKVAHVRGLVDATRSEASGEGAGSSACRRGGGGPEVRGAG